MTDFWWRVSSWLECVLFHPRMKQVSDTEWELVRMPTNKKPAVWRVWRYCRLCGRGRAILRRQLERGVESRSRREPLPMDPGCTFRSVDGRNPRED